MRVPLSRQMAFVVTALSLSAITATGCTSMGRAPGSSWMSSWWHKSPAESYASHTPRPSEQSSPIVTPSLGNASEPPQDPTITPYDNSSNVAQAQGSGGYPTTPAGAIEPNYAAGAGGSNPYGKPGSNYNTTASANGGSQVTPTGGSPYGGKPAGGASMQGNATAQANPYSNPYAGASGYQTADARGGSNWGNNASSTPASSGGYGAPTSTPAATNSSIQPYSGGAYQGGTPQQPYGNPTPPPSYTPPAAGSYSPSSSPSSGGYSSSNTPSSAVPSSPSASMSQPPADGYSPGSISRYESARQKPAPVEGAAEMFDNTEVSPAGYQQGPAATAGGYNSGGAYGGGSASGRYSH